MINICTNVLAFFIYSGTQCFGGIGNLPQTRLAILRTLIALLPVNFLLCVLQFIFKQNNPEQWVAFKIIVYTGILFSLLYALFILIRNIAQFHRLNFVYSIFSIIIGGIIFLIIAQFLAMLHSVTI